MLTLKVNGTKELIQALRKARADVQEDARRVLREQAEAIRQEAEKRCPPLKESKRSTGNLKKSIRASTSPKRLEAYVSAGGKTGNGDAYYAHFVEYGTKNAEAQPFLYPAARVHDAETERKLIDVLDSAVKAAAGE